MLAQSASTSTSSRAWSTATLPQHATTTHLEAARRDGGYVVFNMWYS
ncbi:MAG: hypothetical protein VKK80_05595 [Prochlorothrix sp.]|nr:hypothetical protein [Prochlorothrix sp.]